MIIIGLFVRYISKLFSYKIKSCYLFMLYFSNGEGVKVSE